MPSLYRLFRYIFCCLLPLLCLSDSIVLSQEFYPFRLNAPLVLRGRQVFFSTSNAVRADFLPSEPWKQPPTCGVEVQNGAASVAAGTVVQGVTYLGGTCDAKGAILAAEERGQIVFLRFTILGQQQARATLPRTIAPALTQFYEFSSLRTLALSGKNLTLLTLHDSTLSATPVGEDEIVAATSDFTSGTAAYLTKSSTSALLHILDSNSKEISLFRLPLYEHYTLVLSGTTVGVLGSNDGNSSSFCYVFRVGKGMNERGIVSAHPELSGIVFGRRIMVIGVRSSGGGYSIDFRPLTQSGDAAALTVPLPEGFVEPLSVTVDSLAIILFGNGLILCSPEGEILAAKRFDAGMTIPPDATPQLVGTSVLLRYGAHSLLFPLEQDSFYLLERIGSASGYTIVWGLLVIALLLIYRRYRVVRRALNATLELNGTGIVFLLDAAGRLKRSNLAGRALLGITGDVPLNRPFGYYCVAEGLKQVGAFVARFHAERAPAQEQITAFQQSAREFIMTATPLHSSLAQFRGMIITGVDITEELEKKRLVNWAQLAHDMQTNLSVVRLNAERLTNDGSEANDERRKKILHQSALLLQKVRDIVTVGRNDEMQITSCDAAEICREVLAEFDETIFPDVHIRTELKSCTLECDKRKLSRALRNIVENGIKALKSKPGTVTLFCRQDEQNIRFSVTDTGIGMNEEVRENMLKPYYTTAYLEGGSGIGTMIVQKAAELHHGRIEIHSEEGEGTTFTMIIPKRYDQRRADKR